MTKYSENKTVFYNIVSTIVITGINFFTIPLFTRLLDTSGYGIVNVYASWVQITSILVGFKADGSIGSAKANLDEDEQDAYHVSILVLALVSFLAISLVSVIFMGQVSRWLSMSATLVICMLLQSIGSFVIALFSMRFIFFKEPLKNLILSVGVSVATTLASIILILGPFNDNDPHMGRVLGLCLPNLLIGGILAGSLMRRALTKVRLRYWRFCLALTIPLIFHGLSQLVLSQAGKIGIQHAEGDSAAGVYSIAIVIVSVLNSVYNALNNAFVPFMYDDLAGKTTPVVKARRFSRYFWLFTLITCAFVMMAPEVLTLMAPEKYWSALSLLPVLVISQYFIFLYSFPVNYEFFRMKTRSIAAGTLGAACLTIALNAVLIPRFGQMGAAVASAVAYMGLFVFHFLVARYRLDDRNYPARIYLMGLIVVVAACLSYYPLAAQALVRWAAGILIVVFVTSRVIARRSIF